MISYIVYIIFILVAAAIARHIDTAFVSSSEACETKWSKKRLDDAVITFIVPSLSRPTLSMALNSIMNQTNPNWLILVVFDGLATNSLYLNTSSNLPIYYKELPFDSVNDDRVCFIHGPLNRKVNCGARNRNHAIKFVKTKWIGFLDDDDVIDSKYVHYVVDHEKEYPDAQTILFRMCTNVDILGYLLPPATASNIVRQDVGISFAVRSSVFEQPKYEFFPSNWEDFLFLYTLRVDKVPVLISEHVAYYVKNFTIPQCFQPSIRTYLTNENVTVYPRVTENVAEEERETELIEARLYECVHRAAFAGPKFIFSETNNTFFTHSIRGLQNSLETSIKRKCQGYWRVIENNITIHLVFGDITPPISPYYIQIQLEQRNSFHFGAQYINKLQNALQIWEFSLLNESERLIPGVNTSIYFVPTMLMLDSEPSYKCLEINKHLHLHADNNSNSNSSIVTIPTFFVYQQGIYYKCQVDYNGVVRNIGHEFSPCMKARAKSFKSNVRNAPYCYSSPKIIESIEERNKLCTETLYPKPKAVDQMDIDALMFGKLRDSSKNERERVCDALAAKGVRTVCVESIADKVLERLVCLSRVIVVSNYFPTSALETHFIDPLLQIGKVVVATESFPSSDIDRLYRQVMPIVPKDDLVHTVSHIVNHYDAWIQERQYMKMVHSFVKHATRVIDPICLAISQLEPRLKQVLDITAEEEAKILNRKYHRSRPKTRSHHDLKREKLKRQGLYYQQNIKTIHTLSPDAGEIVKTTKISVAEGNPATRFNRFDEDRRSINRYPVQRGQ